MAILNSQFTFGYANFRMGEGNRRLRLRTTGPPPRLPHETGELEIVSPPIHSWWTCNVPQLDLFSREVISEDN